MKLMFIEVTIGILI